MSKIEELQTERELILAKLLRSAHIQLNILVADSRNTNVTVECDGNDRYQSKRVELRNNPNEPHVRIKVDEINKANTLSYILWAQLETKKVNVVVTGKSERHTGASGTYHTTQLAVQGVGDENPKFQLSQQCEDWHAECNHKCVSVGINILNLFETICERATQQKCDAMRAVNDKLRAIKF